MVFDDLDAVAHSIALRHGLSAERIARMKERVTKSELHLAFERARKRVEAEQLFKKEPQ